VLRKGAHGTNEKLTLLLRLLPRHGASARRSPSRVAARLAQHLPKCAQPLDLMAAAYGGTQLLAPAENGMLSAC
jgi:hypothetical protein